MVGLAPAAAGIRVFNTGLRYTCGGTGASRVGIVFYATSTAFPCGDSDFNGIGDTTSGFGSTGKGAGKGSAYYSESAWTMQFLNGTWETNPKASTRGEPPVRAFSAHARFTMNAAGFRGG